jgi:peptide/nickel transport system substrate-binding protein
MSEPGGKTNPVSRQKLADGGVLRIAVDSFPESWNLWTSANQALDLVTDIMSPRFFTLDSHGDWIWDPTWLESEPVFEANSVTYTLRPQAVWNDGIPLSAEDFWWTWQVCVAQQSPQCEGRGFESIALIEQGENEHTVVVMYDQAYKDWPATFARGPWRATSTSDPAVPATPSPPSTPPDSPPEPGTQPPVHTPTYQGPATIPTQPWDSLADKEGYFSGPFRYASWDGETLRLVRNNLWWGDPPLMDSVELRLVDPGNLALEYERGTVDSFWVTDPNVYAKVAGLSDISLRADVGPTSRWLVANLKSGPLASPLVYRAVLAGLDRYRIGSSDLAGLVNVTTLDNPVFRPFQDGYVNLAADSGEWTAADAAEALDQAGYVVGEDGIRALNGVKLVLRFAIPQGDTLAENEGFSVRAQLRGLGIAVTLVYAGTANVLPESYDLTGVTLLDRSPLCSADRFATDNSWGYDNGDVASAVYAAAHDPDVDSRRARLGAMAVTVWKYGPLIPLYEVPEVFFTRPTVANLGPDGLATTRWENVGWTG